MHHKSLIIRSKGTENETSIVPVRYKQMLRKRKNGRIGFNRLRTVYLYVVCTKISIMDAFFTLFTIGTDSGVNYHTDALSHSIQAS